jgi:hypothetical protein
VDANETLYCSKSIGFLKDTLSVPDLSPGIYYVQVELGGGDAANYSLGVQKQASPYGIRSIGWKQQGNVLHWQSSGSGDLQTWQMNGLTQSQTNTFTSINPNWSAIGWGDFNGDTTSSKTKTDILWRDLKTGNVHVWLMDGANRLDSSVVANAPADWVVETCADFNGDGKDDILWRSPNSR